MKRLGFYYDMEICIGCGACQVACKDVNKLNTTEFFRRVDTLEVKCDNGSKHIHYSGACNHCAEPACVNVCPVEAMFEAEDGTIRHDDGLCIACGACMWSCPYGAISFSTQKGVTQKCESCYELRERGESPACVAACVTHSLKFGVLDEMISQTFKDNVCCDLTFLPSSKETDPSLRILSTQNCSDKVTIEEGDDE
jgi:anaerobic dimethyl sulfoxide reductase subunit B (iron-sulfur subunit)